MSVARNTGYNLASQLIPLVVSIATVPLYLRIVGVERYGVLALCWGLLGFLGFLNLGMAPAVAQKIASLTGAPAAEHARIFWTALWLNVVSGIVGAVLILVLADLYFGSLAEVPGGLRRELRGALPWLSSVILLAMVGGVFTGMLIGQQRFLVLNVINTFSSLLMTLLPLGAAYFFGPRLDYLIIATLLARGLGVVLTLLVCLRAMPVRSPRMPEKEIVGQLLKFGGWVTVTSLIAPFIYTVDQFAIGALVGAAAVSFYVIPFNLVWRICVLPASLAGALSPRFTAATQSEADKLQGEGLASLATIYMPVCIFGVAALGPFMHLWLGPAIADKSLPIAYLMVAAVWANGIARVPHALIEARGRPDLVTKLVLVYLVPYLIILYILLTRYGIMGAAVACCIKSFMDPVGLLALAKTPWRMIRPVVWPTVLVFGAVAAALLVPWRSPLHWAIEGSLLLMSLISAVRMMPPALTPHFRFLFLALRFFDRKNAVPR